MRTLRTVLSALVAALLLVGGLSTSAGAGSLPKRVIEEVPPKTKQVSYNAFKLKGTVSEPQLDGTLLPYANQKVKILKKACGSCKWKTVKKVKTNDSGVSRPASSPRTRVAGSGARRWTTPTASATPRARSGRSTSTEPRSPHLDDPDDDQVIVR